MRAVGIEAGGKVIVLTYTWVVTALAVIYLNVVPVFVDIDPDTYCMDTAALPSALTDYTRAVIPVHLATCIADMDQVSQTTKRAGLNDLGQGKDHSHEPCRIGPALSVLGERGA